MKPITKILIATLGLTALIPLKLGVFCLFSQTDALEFFRLSAFNPDIEKLLIVTGSFVLAAVVFQLLAMVWLMKGKAEGLVVSAMVGIISIGRGALMMISLRLHESNNLRISTSPIVVGLLIVLLTIMAANKQNRI